VTEPEAIGVYASSVPEREDALVRGLLDASPAAHAELYERFAARLQRFVAVRLPGDPETAEEITVQAFIQAAGDIRRFNPHTASLLTWLYGIARRRVIAELRLRNRRKSIPASAQVPLDDARDADGARPLDQQAAERIDAQRQIVALSQVLSPLEMDVLVLNCIDELSLREIGAVVGRSERAVHSLLHRARKKARSLLTSDRGEDGDED
jgi:RNA polymerase sigma-70 factor, ECF subfamily